MERDQKIKEFEKEFDVVVTDRKTHELKRKVDLFVLFVLAVSIIFDIVTILN